MANFLHYWIEQFVLAMGGVWFICRLDDHCRSTDCVVDLPPVRALPSVEQVYAQYYQTSTEGSEPFK